MTDSYTPPPPPPPSGGGGPDPVPKDPIVILVLNLIVAGAGSMVLGQKVKGIVAIVLWLICVPLTCGTMSLVLGVILAVDGYLQAVQLRAGHPIGEWTFFNGHQ